MITQQSVEVECLATSDAVYPVDAVDVLVVIDVFVTVLGVTLGDSPGAM